MREQLDNLVHWFEETVSLVGWLNNVDFQLDEEALTADLNYGRDDDVSLDEPVSPTLH